MRYTPTEASVINHAATIIAKLMAMLIFSDWEAYTKTYILAMIEKYNSELSLGINPINVFTQMEKSGLIKNTYESYYRIDERFNRRAKG